MAGRPDFTIEDVIAAIDAPNEDEDTTVTFVGPIGAAAAKKLAERLDGEAK